MTDKIDLGETPRGAKVELDLQELITGRTFLSCITRYGKSWTARRIAEQLFGRTGEVILDPEGEYVTLRDKFPFLIIGKDVPVVPEAAEYLADQILENNLSVIVDLSDPNLEILTGQEFVARFIDRFIAMETKMRKPYLWILEEADEFAPEKGTFKSASLQAVIKLTKKGGKRGMGVMVVTQRPAFVSKYVISQCTNKLIGRFEWMPDIKIIRDYLRLKDEVANHLKDLNRGEFYISGDFTDREGFMKVGPVETKHLGETPEVVPPAPAELQETLSKLSEALPKVIEEKLAPAVPKVSEIEARIKEKLTGEWQVRLQRIEKERDAIKRKTEAKYEVEIADLRRKLEDAVRAATMKGPVTDLLRHPLVQKNLEKLNDKQRGLIELLESKGPQDAERLHLFLEISPKSIPDFTYKINAKIPKLIENVGGKYTSRLAKLFPVTPELEAEAKESERLRKENERLLKELKDEVDKVERVVAAERAAHHELQERYEVLQRNYDTVVKRAMEKETEVEAPTPTAAPSTLLPPDEFIEKFEAKIRWVVRDELSKVPPMVGGQVDATLKKTLADFNVQVSKETFTVDDTTWEGKILTMGVDGFFDEPKGPGKIMAELIRRWSVSDSGGNRTTVNDRLSMLVSKGILDRKIEGKQWVYFSTPEFRDRVKKA